MAGLDEKKPLDWHQVAYYGRGVFAVVLSLAVLIGGGWYAYSKASELYTSLVTPDDDYVGEGGAEVEVVIPRGLGCCGALSLHMGRSDDGRGYTTRWRACSTRADLSSSYRD